MVWLHKLKKVMMCVCLCLLFFITLPGLTQTQPNIIVGSSYRVSAVQGNSNSSSNRYQAVKYTQQQKTIKGRQSTTKIEDGSSGNRILDTVIIMVLVGSLVYLLYNDYDSKKDLVSGSVAELKYKLGGNK